MKLIDAYRELWHDKKLMLRLALLGVTSYICVIIIILIEGVIFL